jgi:hypothetical protein
MDTDDRPPAQDAAKDVKRPQVGEPLRNPAGPADVSPQSVDAKSFDAKSFDRRRRARNWALLAVLLGLAALFYAITLVKLSKVG